MRTRSIAWVRLQNSLRVGMGTAEISPSLPISLRLPLFLVRSCVPRLPRRASCRLPMGGYSLSGIGPVWMSRSSSLPRRTTPSISMNARAVASGKYQPSLASWSLTWEGVWLARHASLPPWTPTIDQSHPRRSSSVEFPQSWRMATSWMKTRTACACQVPHFSARRCRFSSATQWKRKIGAPSMRYGRSLGSSLCRSPLLTPSEPSKRWCAPRLPTSPPTAMWSARRREAVVVRSLAQQSGSRRQTGFVQTRRSDRAA